MTDDTPRFEDSSRCKLSRRTALKSGFVTASVLGLGLPGTRTTTAQSPGAAAASGPFPVKQEDKFLGEDKFDTFGTSVAVDGDTTVIGADGDQVKPNNPNQGSAYVFTRLSGNWTQQSKLTATLGDTGDQFGSSVTLDGDTAIVGARLSELPFPAKSGVAYVFTRTGDSWSQRDELTASDPETGDYFGEDVALDNGTVVVGAPERGGIAGSQAGAGSAYVFTGSGTSWSEQAKLTASDGDKSDLFGNSVALDGDTTVIGANRDDNSNGTNAGKAYVFTRSGGSWSEQAKLTASDGDKSDQFGHSVALDGDIALIGAYLDDNSNGTNAGKAYVFTRSGGSWSEQAKLTASDGDSDDYFGSSVALDGDIAVIGANRDENPNGTDAGAAYLFTRSGSNWSEKAKIAADGGASGDKFGLSVALNNNKNIAIVGANRDDTNGEDAGAAYAFGPNKRPTASFTVTPGEPTEGEPATFDASGSSDPDGTIATYEWDWDDDGTLEESTSSATTTHTFPTGGDKTVTLRVTDDGGAIKTVTKTIHVNHVPTASFTVSPDPVVRGEPATFDASGSSDPDGSIVTYEWDWDDDGTFEESTSNATTTHTFATGGDKTVILRVTDDDGATDTVTKSFTVYIRASIEIKPNGSGRKPIQPKSRGKIPVAVEHTAAFDPPARLDPATVHFGDPDDVGFDTSTDPATPEGGATPSHGGGHVEDIDGDGDADSVFHFGTRDADFDSNDSAGKLVGLTNDGVPVFGTDGVKIVGKGP